MSTKLMPDAQVPALSVPTVDGANWDLSHQKPANFTMVVAYRGYHCPLCKAYLGKLNGLAKQYEEAGFSILAVSMDTQERARKAKEEWGLSNLAVGYDLDKASAEAWGLWLSSAIREGEAKVFCEPGLFWVRPDGRLYLIDISNMPFARPDLEFLLSKVAMVVENGYPARGTLALAA